MGSPVRVLGVPLASHADEREAMPSLIWPHTKMLLAHEFPWGSSSPAWRTPSRRYATGFLWRFLSFWACPWARRQYFASLSNGFRKQCNGVINPNIKNIFRIF